MTKAKPKTSNFTAGVTEDELEAAIDMVEADPDQTIHLTGIIDPEVPTLEGFAVADDPADLPSAAPAATQAPEQSAPLGYSGLINTMAQGHETFTEARNAMAAKANAKPEPAPLEGDILPPGADTNTIRYESRIRILEAFPYRGSVAEAPDFIDRNWVGWSDYDPVRQMEPGPCLRVPEGPFSVTICRPGDYVVKQEMLDGNGGATQTLQVWEGEQFRRLFIPTLVDG